MVIQPPSLFESDVLGIFSSQHLTFVNGWWQDADDVSAWRSTTIYTSIPLKLQNLPLLGWIQLVLWFKIHLIWIMILLKDHTPFQMGLHIWGDWYPYEFTSFFQGKLQLTMPFDVFMVANWMFEVLSFWQKTVLYRGSVWVDIGLMFFFTKKTDLTNFMFVLFEKTLRTVPLRCTWKEMIHHPG